METLTQERLKAVIDYNPKTGIFRWKEDRGYRAKAGQVAGGFDKDGYIQIGVCGRTYRAGRLAWFYMEGYWPEHQIDHKNRVRADNRWTNLRHMTLQCNYRNKGKYRNNTSGIKGVSWSKQANKWLAKITYNKKIIYLGIYEDINEAAKARLEAEKKYNFHNCI